MQVPFRETHHVAGAVVRLSETLGVSLSQIPVAELAKLHPLLDDPLVASVWDFESSVERRNAMGGTAASSVQRQIADLRSGLC
jgi:argininosuccinate lyase